VTGAGGMLGQEVTRQLRNRGIGVRSCDKAPMPVAQGEHAVQCDLSDLAALTEAAQGCDAIVHLGGISGPGFVFNPAVPAGVVASTNIVGTINALEAAKACGVKRFVFASSVIVYWPVDRNRTWPDPMLIEGRSDVLDSTETYGASKIAGEQLCRAYTSMGVLDAVSLRIGWVYGPGRTTGCPVRALLEGAALDTPPRHKRDFVYVADAAEALVLAALREAAFGGVALNMSGGHISHTAVEGAVHRALGKACQKAPTKENTIDPPIPPMSLNLVKEQLGWMPQVSISHGVQRYAQHLGLPVVANLDEQLGKYVGTFCYNAATCRNALGYYKFWGTLNEEEAAQCAVSTKKMIFSAMSEDRFSMLIRANDTTRDEDFVCDVIIDGTPQPIPPRLRMKANNSIKMNPEGTWTFWWDGSDLMQEMKCIVRGKAMIHNLRRRLEKDFLQCHELVLDAESAEVLCDALLSFKRDDAVAAPPEKKARTTE